jgi:hypothetical protein
MVTPAAPLAYQIRREIDQLEYILHELDTGAPMNQIQLLERLNDIGAKLCSLSDEFYAAAVAIPIFPKGGPQNV